MTYWTIVSRVTKQYFTGLSELNKNLAHDKAELSWIELFSVRERISCSDTCKLIIQKYECTFLNV